MLQEPDTLEAPGPLLYAPPSCHEEMARALTEASGDTYSPAKAVKSETGPPTAGADGTASSAATSAHACVAVALAASTWLLAVSAILYIG